MAKTARELFADSIVVDMTAPGSPLQGPVTPTVADTDRWIEHYESGGVTWASFTVAADFTGGVEPTLRNITLARRFFLSQPDRFILIERADDVLRAKREKKLAVSLHFQGTVPIGTDLGLVEIYKRLGVVHMLMAYNNRNHVADGCHERTDAGLSKFGLSLVQEMNRVGVLVDVTHTGYRSAMDAIEASTAPVIMSHSNPNALYAHDRNVPDDQIVAMAKTGGVMGIHGVGIFLSASGTDVSADILARNIDYTVQLVGPGHVGLGLDYIENLPVLLALVRATGDAIWSKSGGYHNQDQKFASPRVIEGVADVLLRQGYPEADVRGILGENWLRVVREVWG